MSFILFILLFLFVFVFIVLSAGASFLKMLFGGGSDNTRQGRQYTQSRRSQQEASSRHKKVFKKNEGEYVDYEEIK